MEGIVVSELRLWRFWKYGMVSHVDIHRLPGFQSEETIAGGVSVSTGCI
jgi:hypothetical protein